MSEHTIITKQQIIAELFRSPHGELHDYLVVATHAAHHEPAFLAHGIAWNQRHGTIRDSRLALPTITLVSRTFPDEFVENTLAHLALLTPRQLAGYARRKHLARTGVWPLLRNLHPTERREKAFRHMITGYLRAREACWPWWERTALRFRGPLASLYKIAHLQACPEAKAVLFPKVVPRHPIDVPVYGLPPDSVFARMKVCKDWPELELAGFIRAERIPFLTILGIVGKRIQEPAIMAAVIEQASPTELTNHRKAFERWGASQDAATRGAMATAVGRAKAGTRDILKTTVAAQALEDDAPELAAELEAIQEAQLEAAPGIDGNVLIAGDKSGSMQQSMAYSLMLAAYVARKVTGQVLLAFFDTEPLYFDVTSKTYTDIRRIVAGITANGGTHIGSSLLGAKERKFIADIIMVVSDGGDNTPHDFATDYLRYTAWAGNEPPVYLYHVAGDTDRMSASCEQAGLPFQRFDIPRGMDHYALETLAATMTKHRYGLVDTIMQTPLLTMDQALRPPKQYRGVLV